MQEESIQSGFDRFVEVLEQKLAAFESRMREEFQTIRTEMQTVRAELLKEQRDQMLKFAALVSLIALVTGTVIKLF